MTTPPIINKSTITISGLTDDMFTTDGKAIADPVKLLSQIGLDNQLDHLLGLLPEIINKGNQGTTTGVIQDPAGSAVGAGVPLYGGGGSGAIYSKFPDLKAIPQMSYTEAVFNSTDGLGYRVLHTYSPDLGALQLHVDKLYDREKAIELISRSYANAMYACYDAEQTLADKFKIITMINFTAVSGNIYAGSFKTSFPDPSKQPPTMNHLHPSYQLLAIMIAYNEVSTNNFREIPGKLFLYDAPVYAAAAACKLAWSKLASH